MTGKKYIIWGSLGHAKVLNSLIMQQGGRVVALFDNNPEAVSVIKDVEIFIGEKGFHSWLKTVKDPSEFYGLVAIGGAHGVARMQIQQIFTANGVRVEPVIHQKASVCATAKIGAGSHILANATVAADAVLGEACIINHGSSVDHECILGNGVHLAPGSILCGCIELEDNVMIGAGAVVLPRIKIGRNAIVGAGSVVTKDVPADALVYGNPVRLVDQHEQ